MRDIYPISFATPNLSELRVMAQFLDSLQCTNIKADSELSEIVELSSILSPVIKFLVITMGSKGVITIKNLEHEIIARFYPTEPIGNIENVSGAGDCFASGYIHGMLSGRKESQCMFMGLEAAKMALLCRNTVPSNLNCINSSPCQEAKYKQLK